MQNNLINWLIFFDGHTGVLAIACNINVLVFHRFKKIIPIPEQSMVQMLCYLLECLLTPENTPPDCAKELYELYFVFAAVWAFGGTMFQDQVFCWPLGIRSCISSPSMYSQCSSHIEYHTFNYSHS